MGLFALSASVGGAAFIGFGQWPFWALSAWAVAWGLAFLWTHRASMAAARADLRQRDEPAILPWLAYSTSIFGTVVLFMIGHTAAWLIAGFIGCSLGRVLGG